MEMAKRNQEKEKVSEGSGDCDFPYIVSKHWNMVLCFWKVVELVGVVVLGFYVPPTAKAIRRRDLCLKSHPKDWRSPGSNSRHLVDKASSLTTAPRRLLWNKFSW